MDVSGTIEIDFPSSDSDDVQSPSDNTSSPYTSSSETLRTESTRWKLRVFIKRLTNIKLVHRNFCKRIIKSKPVIIILIINLLQTFSFSITTIAAFHKIENKAAPLFFIAIQTGGFSALFNPIGGFLGDMIGRHKISVICLFTSFFVSVLHVVLLSLWNYYDEGIFSNTLILMFILILTISASFFSMNWLTFGADQLISSPSEETSSYIYWWSWTRNPGTVIALLTHAALSATLSATCMKYMNDNTWLYINFCDPVMICVMCAVLSSVVYSIVLFLDLATSSKYDRERNISNPIKLIFGVFRNAWTNSKCRLTRFRSAFDYGEDPPSGLNHALIHHGGMYTEEEVESVRSCGQIALMILVITMNGYFAIYFAFHTLTAHDFNTILNMDPLLDNITQFNISLTDFMSISLNDSLSTLIDSSLSVVLLPTWNLLLFPIFGHYAPNTRKRIGFGSILGVLGMITAAIIAGVQSEEDDGFYMILPLIIIVVGETFVIVPGLEFVYAQSPDNMKGLLLGFQFFLIGTWAVIAAGITYAAHKSTKNHQLCVHRSYMIGYCILGVVGLAIFTVASCRYTNRKRNNPITDIMRISSYY